LILGGDLTGKQFVPVFGPNPAGGFRCYFSGRVHECASRSEALKLCATLDDQGVYAFLCPEDEWQATLSDAERLESFRLHLMRDRLAEWVGLAETRLAATACQILLNLGNDDPVLLDEVIDGSTRVIRPEGRVVMIHDRLPVISTGYATLTPFNCPRDIPDEALRTRIVAMVRQLEDPSKSVFNFHCPPQGTVLDRAVRIDAELRPVLTGLGVDTTHVGSQAVREIIEEFQPCLGLHGHVHESPGVVRLGRTLCVNPGTEYVAGILRAVVVDIEDGKVMSHSFVSG
jgi:Icc-related predicted phosphoesterase